MPVAAVLPALSVGVGFGPDGTPTRRPEDLGQQVRTPRMTPTSGFDVPTTDLLDPVPELVADRRVVAPRRRDP
jgi:hypothetical protein